MRSLFFTLVHPGLVAGLLPWLIARMDWKRIPADPFHPTFYVGLLMFLPGLSLLGLCIIQFAKEGKGTLSPADPTRVLVTGGLYRYSRNPMYLGVLLMLAGESIITGSIPLWIYTILVALLFHLFVIFHEESRNRRDFGADYSQYCTKVRRWL